MALSWMNGGKYERVPITSGTGPGTYHADYAWAIVLHSTEGPPGSMDGTISWFRSRPLSCPHFIIDPMGTGRRVQCIPMDWSACALRGGSGGWQTNRGRAIQVEICGYAKDAGGWPDSALRIIGDWCADVVKAGYPINTNMVSDSRNLSGTLATMNAPQRMSWSQWKPWPGITAHVFMPGQDHWDCGRLDSLKVARYCREALGGRLDVPGGGGMGGQLPSAPANPAPDMIQLNMTGGGVKFVQELLAGIGYDVGPHDGVFGPATDAAVRAFQQAEGLSVDGVCGPQTLQRIAAHYGTPRPAAPPPGAPSWPGRYLVLTAPPMTGADVGQWQARMHERGWRLDVDGVYGESSRSTCKTFQAEKGIEADGVVGPVTWAAAWGLPVT